MKFIRYSHKQQSHAGILEDGRVFELKGDIFGDYTRTGNVYNAEEITLLAPVQPGKIIGLSNVNYYSRMQKLALPPPDQILFFIKPPNTMNDPGRPIELPRYIKRAAHELELTIVVGKKGKHLSIEDAHRHIFGYTLANDITARDFMVVNMPVGKAKSLDTINPVGPCIETDVDLSTLHYQMYVSGELRHDVFASDLIYSPAQIVSELSQIMTLEPGDIIMTGAPFNNIEFQIGDVIEIRCQQIGNMTNEVIGI